MNKQTFSPLCSRLSVLMAFPIPVTESFPPDEFQISLTQVTWAVQVTWSPVYRKRNIWRLTRKFHLTLLYYLLSLKPLVPTQKTNSVTQKSCSHSPDGAKLGLLVIIHISYCTFFFQWKKCIFNWLKTA